LILQYYLSHIRDYRTKKASNSWTPPQVWYCCFQPKAKWSWRISYECRWNLTSFYHKVVKYKAMLIGLFAEYLHVMCTASILLSFKLHLLSLNWMCNFCICTGIYVLGFDNHILHFYFDVRLQWDRTES